VVQQTVIRMQATNLQGLKRSYAYNAIISLANSDGTLVA